MRSVIQKRTRDPTDPILDVGLVQGKLRGRGHVTQLMEAKIMKYQIFHGLLGKFCQKIKIELSFLWIYYYQNK